MLWGILNISLNFDLEKPLIRNIPFDNITKESIHCTTFVLSYASNVNIYNY